MAKIVYGQMPAPRKLSQHIPAPPRTKARMQKPQGEGKIVVQIREGARRGIVMDEIDTCIIRTTSCYQKHLFLSRLPLFIGSTSCYRDYLLLSETPLVIETTSCYRKHSCYRDYVFLSEAPLVIKTISCHPDYLLLSETPLVIESTSCYRKAFLSDSERHTISNNAMCDRICDMYMQNHILAISLQINMTNDDKQQAYVNKVLKQPEIKEHIFPV